MGFSRGCAEQMLHVMTNPANIGRDYKDLFTVDCLPEVNRYDRSVKDKVLSDTAKAFGTTTDALKAFANIPDREFKASIEREEQRIREGSKNDLDLKWAMKNEKATHDCIEVRGPQNCGTGEDLQPFRDRLVLFLVADKEVWLSPEDEGFRSLQPYSIDHQRKRETLLAALGDYSSTTIDSIQNSAARPQQITEVQNDKVVVRPSFDCAMARSPVELLICGDGYLASLEVGMASAYNQALARVRDDGRKTLKQQHLNWFRNYSRTCNRADNDTDRTTCVSSFLSARTSDLNNLR
jgi:hypothetical protein